MTYAANDHWLNAIVKPYALSRDFVQTDLAESEAAGVTRAATVAGDLVGYYAVPLDIPLFQAEQAIPLLLMSGGITLELITNTAAQGLRSVVASATDFSLSNMSLVYETVTVSPEFKQALVAASAQSPFSIACNDRIYLGQYSASASARLNIGCGLSSVKSVVGTIQASGLAVTADKSYILNGAQQFVHYVNGEVRSPPNMDNDVVVFNEFQRSIGGLYDANMTSVLVRAANVTTSAVRNFPSPRATITRSVRPERINA